MRMVLRGMRAIFITIIALACAAGAILLLHAPVFEEGKRYELYLAPSSSALMLESGDPALDKLLYSVKGESVSYDGDKKMQLMTRFRAKVLFTEEAAGVTNYYCYSPLLKESVALRGQRVNLHIAVSEQETAAGTPIIFGGF